MDEIDEMWLELEPQLFVRKYTCGCLVKITSQGNPIFYKRCDLAKSYRSCFFKSKYYEDHNWSLEEVKSSTYWNEVIKRHLETQEFILEGTK